MAFVNMQFFSDFFPFDKSLLLLTVTLLGVSNKHCLLSLFFIAQVFSTIRVACLVYLCNKYVNNVPYIFLAHLSRRLTGELIVYTGIRRPSVRPTTFSNDISSEAVRRILSILHI